MIEHIWTVLCQKSIIDSATNNITLFEVLEELRVEIYPLPSESALIPVQMQLVSFLTRSIDNLPCRGEVRFRLLDPSGSITVDRNYPVDLTTSERLRLRVSVPSLRIRESGRYQYNVQVRQDGQTDWEEVAKIPLTLNLVPEHPRSDATPPVT